MGKKADMITDYKDKKLVEYLDELINRVKSAPQKPKILIRWGHGLGDLLMFYPLYEKLQQLYPEIEFNFYCECGQEDIVPSVADKDDPDYDVVFNLDFPMAVKSGFLKAERCAYDELGLTEVNIRGGDEVMTLCTQPSPWVACHFQGTALPHSVNCSEEVARKIWQEIKDFGKTPVECHYQHVFHNAFNKKYVFIDVSVRNYRATLPNLIGLIQRSWAFIGVASGPFVVGLSTMPERSLYLEKSHPLETYTRRTDIAKVNIDEYSDGMVTDWLTTLEGG